MIKWPVKKNSLCSSWWMMGKSEKKQQLANLQKKDFFSTKTDRCAVMCFKAQRTLP